MNPVGRCQACLALLMAGLFALCHPVTARPRPVSTDPWRPRRALVAAPPRRGR